MLHKLLILPLLASFSFANSMNYIPNLNAELQQNKKYISQYEKSIKQLQERNKILVKAKEQNPKLYEQKPLFEETQEAYIKRIKLGGAEAKNVNFEIKEHRLSLGMSIKITRDDENGYYQSSRSFYQEYAIPNNVEESKISNYIDGDYFVVKMPKKETPKK